MGWVSTFGEKCPQIMLRLISLENIADIFWFSDLNFCPLWTGELMDSMELLEVCLIRPEETEELPECVT